MPQKLPPNVLADPTGDPLGRRPEHAALIGRIAGSWSVVEFMLASLLSRLMEAKARSALALYGTFANARAQRQAILAVANVALPPDLASDLEKLLDESHRRSKERNRIVHALWATVGDDSLIIALDADRSLHRIVEFEVIHRYGSKRLEDLGKVFEMPEPQDCSYTKADFENVLRRLQTHRNNIEAFIVKLMEWHARP